MNKLITIFKIPELAQKIGITLLFLVIYRLGSHIPLPILDQHKLAELMGQFSSEGFGRLLNFAAMFSGVTISQSTILGLGIMPYISASIIMQLLASVVPSLEKLQKEGESGRRKINEITRYVTVLICLIQSWMWMRFLSGGGMVYPQYNVWYLSGIFPGFYMLTAILTMTAGTLFLMWLGEQIDEYGIGNGISLIIMAGIVARIPTATQHLFFNPDGTLRESIWQIGGGQGNDPSLEVLLTLVVLFIGVVIGVVAITKAQRRIPTQSARHVRGRRVYGGTRQFLPLRVNQAGVMPVIFASSLLMIPYFIFNGLAGFSGGRWEWASELAYSFQRQGYIYNVCYIAMIYFFCYFWTAITFNPKDMANNLRDYGSFIPGYRPGKRTAEYLERVMVRITYVGAAFLALVAIIPTLISSTLGVDPLVASFYGGTGLLIVVSVALDLVQKINSHLVMRNYPGLTED